MKTDLMLLTLMYGVALAAFIGAINARGPARVALSYFLAILCLCAAVFHTSQYLAVKDLDADSAVVIPPPPPTAAVPEGPTLADSLALEASRNEAALAEGRNELNAVLESVRRVSRNLSSLNLGAVADISDEEYETLQNRALGYLSEARRAKENLASLSGKLPPQLKEAGDILGKGVESLVGAAYNAERFFKSENDSEEKQHVAAFRRGTQDAGAAFEKAAALIGGSQDAGE